MSERELLELAADAFGLPDYWTYSDGIGLREQAVHGVPHCGHVGPYWNPLTDDGDALRLAVKLKIKLLPENRSYARADNLQGVGEDWGDDTCAATRRAITRVAAGIGEVL